MNRQYIVDVCVSRNFEEISLLLVLISLISTFQDDYKIDVSEDTIELILKNMTFVKSLTFRLWHEICFGGETEVYKTYRDAFGENFHFIIACLRDYLGSI